ncbi:hypothetical protein B0T26DRAFT_6644 [Lasiosphaeria miniovina]|uniref:Uncharacterized protein n=1 Tax=Lasiosphaeria miniovina TaxID=1954250 RepID=A0AA40EAV3_9PEZI|nr:uncharacterized protein B0T26DRAFT_6644 [Lasiosphaeria miniovina]KAK0733160.1 hypothetical protein B0T26DRAFT_6644 [Lasiosphaeria miniovina]
MQPIIVAILGALIRSVAAQDGPPQDFGEAFPSGLAVLNDGQNGRGLKSMPTPSYTSQRWPGGLLPEPCASIGDAYGCPRTDFEVYNVTYSDCPVPKTICRCSNSLIPFDEIAEEFGRIPMAARQMVRTFSSVQTGGCGGFSNGADIWLVGACRGSPSVYFHEVGHMLDCQRGGGRGFWSEMQEWKNVVTQTSDTCVSDNYAKNGWADNFAQTGVMIAYDLNVAPITDYPVSCMSNQISKAREVLLGAYSPDQGRCTQSVKQGRVLCVSDEARAAGLCSESQFKVAAIQESKFKGVEFVDLEAVIQVCTGFKRRRGVPVPFVA